MYGRYFYLLVFLAVFSKDHYFSLFKYETLKSFQTRTLRLLPWGSNKYLMLKIIIIIKIIQITWTKSKTWMIIYKTNCTRTQREDKKTLQVDVLADSFQQISGQTKYFFYIFMSKVPFVFIVSYVTYGSIRGMSTFFVLF